MRTLIYGCGAVGLGIASCLLKSKDQVDIVARESTVLALRKHGLVRTGIWGDYSAEPAAFAGYTSLSEIGTKVYDYILVCTKSFDSFEAAKDLSQSDWLFGERTKIVLFQNGWGNAEVFSSFFKPEMIYNARVITGFSRPKNNEVAITVHADSIHIGSLFSSDLACIENLCQSIAKGGIPCEATTKIEKDLWAKMLYNCALNPLGAILDVPYGVLAENESTRIIMKGIVEEVFDVMKVAGCETHWQSPKDFLEVFYKKLVPDTAEHKSSTLQDILAKKTTEIDALNGAVITLAEKYGVRVPYNSAIYNIVKFIEAKSS
ncbi:MAG TPA: 2-dehydropantoate 2-reductase [Sedimentisphaerales bacterium]|nr:2-dehydropantoate 2-reductase [Sedimentisphaerales bacterium]